MIQSTQLKAHCQDCISNIHLLRQEKFKLIGNHTENFVEQGKMTEGLTWWWDQLAYRHEQRKHHSRSSQHAYKQKHVKPWDAAAGTRLLRCSVWSSMYAHGAIIARAGLLVDCALESQSSSCAFSWDPIIRADKRSLNHEAIGSLFWSEPTIPSFSVLLLYYYYILLLLLLLYRNCFILPLWPVFLFSCFDVVKSLNMCGQALFMLV